MKITLYNHDFDFEIHGTVGIIWTANRLMQDEELDLNNPMHHLRLFYAVIKQCNKHQDIITSYDDFEMALTNSNIKQMREYFFERWNELEPATSTPTQDTDDSPKNA